MSQANVDLTHRVLDAFNSREVERFLAMMSPQVEAIPRIAGALGSSIRGLDDLRRWRLDLLEILPDLRTEALEEVRDLGEVTVVPVRYSGRGGTSDTPFDEENWWAGRWRSGLCVFWCGKPSEAEALEAAGLSE